MHIRLISLVFFLSGCSALAFETVWFRMTSIALGSSVWSAAAVLSAFMAGLAIGNTAIAIYGNNITKPFSTYILIELIIGITGVASVFFINTLSTEIAWLLSDITNDSTLLNTSRFAVAFIILLIPSVGMGMTLPILHKGLFHFDNSFSRSLGKLYGWNTLGAVSGVLLSEFLLISYLGIKGTAFTACLFNFIAALILLRLFHNNPFVLNKDIDNKIIATRLIRQIKGYILPPFFTGFLLLALEIVWFRYLLLHQSGTSTTFSIMLATILTGIGLGGLIASRIKNKKINQQKLIINLSLFAAVITVSSFHLHHLLILNYFTEVKSEITYSIISAAVLMLPTSIISGFLFPLYGEMLYKKLSTPTQASGLLTLFNTAGAAIGSVFATFILIPYIGIENSILVLALGYIVVAVLLVINLGVITNNLNIYLKPSIVLLVIFALFPYGNLDKEYSNFRNYYFEDKKLVKIKEGLNETVQYLKHDFLGEPLNYRLITNSVSMSGTNFEAKRYMKLYVYLPYALKEDIKNVLLISYGVGNTAEAIINIDTLDNFDVVDISKDVLELSDIIHNTSGTHPLKSDKTQVHIEDGRFYLNTTKQTYDLITGEPPPPKQAGVVNLYTKEYFELLYKNLNLGGITSYWLPVYQMQNQESLAIIKAFCLVFSDCSLWSGAGLELMLLGSRGGIKPVSTVRFREIWNSNIGDDLKRMGIENPGLLSTTFIADNKILMDLTSMVEPVTDNYPHRIFNGLQITSYDTKLYQDLLNINRRHEAFINSSYINRIYPEKLIKETEENFFYENLFTILIEPAPIESGVAVVKIYLDVLSHLLTETTFETLPLLALNGRPRELEIMEEVDNDGSPEYQWAYIKSLLVKRRYEETLVEMKKYINLPVNTNKDYLRNLYVLIKEINFKNKIKDN